MFNLQTIRLSLTAVPALAATATLTSAPLDPSIMPADVAWYAHVDVDAAMDSPLGTQIRDTMTPAERAKLRAFTRLFGFSPLEDVSSVTLWGIAGYPDKGVVVGQGDFDQALLIDLVAAGGNYTTAERNGYVLHSWDDDDKPGKRVHGTFTPTGLLLLSDVPELIDLAMKIAREEAPAATASTIEAATYANAFFLASVDFDRLPNLETENDVTKHLNQAVLSVNQSSDALTVAMSLTAKSADAASQVRRSLDGILAFTTLAAKDPTVITLLDSVRLKGSGNEVTGTVEITNDEIAKTIDAFKGLK